MCSVGDGCWCASRGMDGWTDGCNVVLEISKTDTVSMTVWYLFLVGLPQAHGLYRRRLEKQND
jgi:hypothetical protein